MEEYERKGITRKNVERTEQKRRRGMIEKKRRDRMNRSYMELMQLVPKVQRKKYITNVAKSELLEMTVEYIRKLHLLSKENNFTVADPCQFHKAGFQDCSTKFIQYINDDKGLGRNDLFQQNLLVFIEERLSNVLGNNKVEEDTSFASTCILNQSKAISSPTTFKNSLATISYPSTKVSSTNNDIARFIFQPALHSHILLHNSTVFVNPGNVSILNKPNCASITHSPEKPDNNQLMSTNYIGNL